jgi:hypothetical protein
MELSDSLEEKKSAGSVDGDGTKKGAQYEKKCEEILHRFMSVCVMVREAGVLEKEVLHKIVEVAGSEVVHWVSEEGDIEEKQV